MILVDSNVWIFAATENAPERQIALDQLALSLPTDVVVNGIIFSEVFHRFRQLFGVAPAREKVTEIVHHPSVHWLDVGKADAEEAMKLSEKHSIRINDAIIAGQALRLKVPVLTDNVRDFRRVKGLKVVPLR
ncbi:MAG: type II toxin-antitoxin system VapC family toxin [Candidatus Aenigmarchaeota archaeon]|nr:type II toxin-antitoxin system VapC family toxin [Candidatus Aenigmarchaeota archaeon]